MKALEFDFSFEHLTSIVHMRDHARFLNTLFLFDFEPASPSWVTLAAQVTYTWILSAGVAVVSRGSEPAYVGTPVLYINTGQEPIEMRDL